MLWSTDAEQLAIFANSVLSVLHYVITRLGCLPMRLHRYLCMLNASSMGTIQEVLNGTNF